LDETSAAVFCVSPSVTHDSGVPRYASGADHVEAEVGGVAGTHCGEGWLKVVASVGFWQRNGGRWLIWAAFGLNGG
jgi:hypothetical protein